MTRRDPWTAERVDLLFPIDALHRELDARLFVAGLCARESTRIFVGQHDVIFGLVPHMSGGVYVGGHIFNSIFSNPNIEFSRYDLLKRRGLTLVHLDEEGGILPGTDPEHWRSALMIQLDPRILAADDYICTWGSFQERFYGSLSPACRDHITTTGQPRFDLYKPQHRPYFDDEVQRLRNAYGDFILYNTTFVAAQPRFGIADWFAPRHGYDARSDEQRARSIGIWAKDARSLNHAVLLCDRLASEFPNRKLVIRPHPSEDAAIYHAIFDEMPNVVVMNEGSVAPWLLACDVLIHSGCTTGMEAFLADTPVLYYRPEETDDDPAESLLAGMFGVRCVSADEVVARIGRARGEIARSPAPTDERAYELIANLRCEALSPLVNIILRVAAQQRTTAGPGPSDFAVRAMEARRTAVARAKGTVRPLFPDRQARFEGFRSYFPGIDRSAINSSLSKVAALIGVPLRATYYSAELFSVERAPS